MKKITLFTAWFALGISAYSQYTAKGYVYNDLNKNGKMDRKEKGVAGVAVCNGAEVTVTNEKGRYELPVGSDNIVFVIKPTGYAVPVSEKKQPQFYYIHKPSGSPTGFKYAGVPATKNLPSQINFGLYEANEPANFTALIFGDPQPYTEQEIDYFSKGIVAEVEGIKDVSFGLSLGDLVGDNLSLHGPYINAVQKMGIPWYNLMGNHDMNYEARVDSLSDETYEANFGPANYSFNYGQVHFIILDDILYPDPRDGKAYWGGFRKSQLDFIENDLKQVDKNKLIVLAMHIPLENTHNTFRKEDRDRLFSLLKDFPNTVSLSAHTHLQRNDFYTAEHGWLGANPHHEYNAGTTSGDWYSGELNEQGIPVSTMRDGTPKGYAYMRFIGNRYVIDYKVAGKSADYQIQIFTPFIVPTRGTTARIHANFFMGHPKSKVEYRIDNGEWKPMTFAETQDPIYLGLQFRWDFTDTLLTGRRPSVAANSTHLWDAPFPRGLSVGNHTVDVRATDMFGRVFTAQKGFQVQ